MTPFIIDCDTGRDDALTLWLAARGGLPLAGVVASYGNTALDKVIDNTQRVLALGCHEAPLFAGAHRPATPHKFVTSVVEARQRISGNGLCDLSFPAATGAFARAPASLDELAAFLVERAATHGPLHYFIIGPATNFAALAALLGARLAQCIEGVTMLGGKLSPLWEEVPGADFNVASDPPALADAMRTTAAQGIPMRFVPLNATWPIYLTLPQLEALTPRTPLAQQAKDLMIAHCRHFAPEPIFRFHDPSVLLAAQKPERFVTKKLRLIVEESAEDFGRLIEDARDGLPCGVYETDAATQAQFRDEILRILGFDAAERSL